MGAFTRVYKFYTSDTPRFLTVTGGTRNMRDAGGCVQKLEIKDFRIINFGNEPGLKLPSTIE